MWYVIEKAFGPDGSQIDSYDIATYQTESQAQAYADKLTTAQELCPPNANEPKCEWFVQSV